MQPFERLKPLTPLPKQLPFGPRHSSLYRADLAGSVLPGRGYISYRFGTELARDKVRLNWTVLARVVPISRSGKEIGHPRVQRRRFVTVGEARKASMRLLLSTLPALFRAEIEITDGSGKRLGRYGEYLRTLPPRFQVALRTDARRYSPGDVIRMRLLNLGTETIFFGDDFAVEAFNGMSWSPTTAFPRGPVKKIVVGIGAGVASRCWEILVGSAVPAGVYRVVNFVSPLVAGPDRERRVAATFEVR